MRKPKKHFTERDQSRRCVVCRRPLKLNLLATRPDATHCYKHWKELKLSNSKKHSKP